MYHLLQKVKIALFFWDHNIISVTMNSSVCKIYNNSNLKFFSNQQWMKVSTSSSPKLNTDTTVNTEMEILAITLRIKGLTRLNKGQCGQKSPLIFFQIRLSIHQLEPSSLTPSPLLLGCCSSVPIVGFFLHLFCCLLW